MKKILGLVLALSTGIGGFMSGFAYSVATTPRPEPPVTPEPEPEPEMAYYETEALLVECYQTSCPGVIQYENGAGRFTNMTFRNWYSVRQPVNQTWWGWAQYNCKFPEPPYKQMCEYISVRIVRFEWGAQWEGNLSVTFGPFDPNQTYGTTITFPGWIDQYVVLYTERGSRLKIVGGIGDRLFQEVL